MRSDMDSGSGDSVLVVHVRDGKSIQIFDDEDMAAEFISIVKMYDPSDEFIYVIYPHSVLAGKFIIKIFSPLMGYEKHGIETSKPAPAPAAADKILRKAAA